jgi:hypothetical protein
MKVMVRVGESKGFELAARFVGVALEIAGYSEVVSYFALEQHVMAVFASLSPSASSFVCDKAFCYRETRP